MTTDRSREPLWIADPKATLELLWSEYQYRHDLSWRVVLQMTGASVILASLPYANVTITKALGQWILPAPLIRIALTFFGCYIMEAELSLLDLVREKYRQFQQAQLGLDHKPTSGFSCRVRVYLILLLVLQFLNLLAVIVIWVPRTMTLPG
jgi:hypothetical protein